MLARYFDTAQLTSDWDSLKEADAELLVNSLSILCPFDPAEKQALLEAPTLATRRETLVTLMEFALRSGGTRGRCSSDGSRRRRAATPIDRRLLEFLVCPVTRGRLAYDAARQELVSRGAGLASPIQNGIPVMLVEAARRLD